MIVVNGKSRNLDKGKIIYNKILNNMKKYLYQEKISYTFRRPTIGQILFTFLKKKIFNICVFINSSFLLLITTTTLIFFFKFVYFVVKWVGGHLVGYIYPSDTKPPIRPIYLLILTFIIRSYSLWVWNCPFLIQFILREVWGKNLKK